MKRRRAPGGGRKPRGEFSGKSSAFSTRVTPELRAKLDEESRRTGRSISQIVERRLRESFDRPRRTEAAWGPDHIRALAYCVAQIAVHIEAGTGKRWHEDQFTNEALQSGLKILLYGHSPHEQIVVPERVIEQVDRLGIGPWMKEVTEFGQQKATEFLGALEYLAMAGSPTQGAYYNPDLEGFYQESSLLQFIINNIVKKVDRA